MLSVCSFRLVVGIYYCLSDRHLRVTPFIAVRKAFIIPSEAFRRISGPGVTLHLSVGLGLLFTIWATPRLAQSVTPKERMSHLQCLDKSFERHPLLHQNSYILTAITFITQVVLKLKKYKPIADCKGYIIISLEIYNIILIYYFIAFVTSG